MRQPPRTDAPRTNREPLEIDRKLAALRDPHVSPLTDLVDRWRTLHPDGAVPYFDPTEAGVGARILILLEAPGRRSALEGGSGFVSPDNDDQTAENMWTLLRDADIDRGASVVTWNVVPWYLGDGVKIRAAKSEDLNEAREATRELISLLPALEVVLLLGKPAAIAWGALGLSHDFLEGPHPSPLNLNTRPERRDELRSLLVEARRRIQG